MFRIAGRNFESRASRSSCSFAFKPSVYYPGNTHQRAVPNSHRTQRKRHGMTTHLLPRGFLLRECVQSLVQRVSDDRAHSLVPRPVRVNSRLAEQMHERLLPFLHRGEPVVRDHGVVRQIGACGEDARRVEG